MVCIKANLDTYSQPRKVNEIYTITDIYTCKHGIQNLNINNQIGRHNITECTCGCKIKGSRYYTNSIYFRKLDYEFAENLLAEISEAMKSETIKN